MAVGQRCLWPRNVAVTITGGRIPPRERAFNPNLHSEETATQSLSSTAQAVLLTTNLTTFGGGTASGPLVDLYTLADGTEGQEKELLMLATGEVKIDLSGTATRITLEELDDFVYLRFKKDKWRRFAPITATATAAGGGGDPHYVSHDITHITDLPLATGGNALAMGDGTRAGGLRSIAIGDSANASGSLGVAIGNTATAEATRSVAIGDRAIARKVQSIAIGNTADAAGNSSVCIGDGSDTGGQSDIAIGAFAFCTAVEKNIAIGDGAACDTSADSAIAIGDDATSSQVQSVAIGKGVKETIAQCTRLGGTGALTIPAGTTAQRPAGRDGMIRFNTTLGVVEFYNGGWAALSTATGAA